jgi:AcrR family transcriptional regulator
MTSTRDTESKGRRRARKGDGDALGLEILDAAEALFIEAGSKEAVTIRAIADRVGVTPPSIYLHYEDKDQLMYQVCRRNFEKLAGRMAEALGEGSVIQRISRLGVAYMRFGLESPGQYRVLFLGKPPDAIEYDDDPGVRAYGMLTALLEEGIATGELRGDLDIDSTAFFLWSTVHGATLLLVDKESMSDHLHLPGVNEAISAVTEEVIRAIRA